MVARGRAEAQRLRAKDALSSALQSGDAERIDWACNIAENIGVDESLVSQGRAGIRRQSKEILGKAFQSGDAGQINRALTIAENAGLDVRLLRAQVKLLQAIQSEDTALIEQACAQAEEVGVDEATVSHGRSEIRRLGAHTPDRGGPTRTGPDWGPEAEAPQPPPDPRQVPRQPAWHGEQGS